MAFAYEQMCITVTNVPAGDTVRIVLADDNNIQQTNFLVWSTGPAGQKSTGISMKSQTPGQPFSVESFSVNANVISIKTGSSGDKANFSVVTSVAKDSTIGNYINLSFTATNAVIVTAGWGLQSDTPIGSTGTSLKWP